jgi:NAD(P)-dependent dehydrogenase (short-subunit alcohol dehydrogenase family)
MKLEGARAVVTGAASGIGRALVLELAGHGALVLAVDVSERVAAWDDLPPGRRAQVAALRCDVSTAEGVDRIFEEAKTALGGVDLFVANAGFAYHRLIGPPDWRAIETIFRTNVFSPAYTVQRMAAEAGDRPWRVVITASAQARLPLAGYALYAASKAAVDRLAEALRLELPDPDSIAVVYPIATATGFFAAAHSPVAPPWPLQTAGQVARAVVRGLERDRRAIHPSPLFHALQRFAWPVLAIYQRLEARRFLKAGAPRPRT